MKIAITGTAILMAIGISCIVTADSSPVITLNPQYEIFRGMDYGDYRNEYSSEMNWINAYIGATNIPNSKVYAVFMMSDADTGTEVGRAPYELIDSDPLFRLSGNVHDFFPDVKTTMTPKELVPLLSWGGSNAAMPSCEILGGPPTIYYIADNFAEIEFDADGNGRLDTKAAIALYEDGKFSPDSDVWLFFIGEYQ